MTEKWWQNEIFYQIYPASFKDANNDGIGDLKGIIEKLPTLSALGITTIWLSPIYCSPMCDNGYDISDYENIEPKFGTMADFNHLVASAKKLDIKIIMDLVINHTSDQHLWFKKALKNPNSPYRDYYIFKQGLNGEAPNNWRSNFGKGSSWTKVSGEDNVFYHHVFSKHQPDLNWENPRMRQEIYNMINRWLARGVAGFRVDAITFIKKDQDFASIEPDGVDGLGKVKRKAENRLEIEKFLNELNEKTFEQSDAVTIGEASGVSYDELGQFIGEKGYFSMIFDFHYADIDVYSGSEWYRKTKWTVKELRDEIYHSQLSIQKVGWAANFLENHDQPRSINKYIKDVNYQGSYGAKTLGILFFFLRGCPFIYQGQEIGMVNAARTQISDFNDVSSHDNYERAIEEGFTEKEALKFVNDRSRDNGRVPFHWNNDRNHGFNRDHKPWLAFSTQDKLVNVKDERKNVKSVWYFYKRMIEIRKNPTYSADLISGDFKVIESNENVIAYGRGEKIQIYVNLSSKVVETAIPHGNILLNTYEDYTNNTLFPYQGILIEVDKNE